MWRPPWVWGITAIDTTNRRRVGELLGIGIIFIRIRLYVLRKGFPSTNPMIWGSTLGRGSWFLGYKLLAVAVLLVMSKVCKELPFSLRNNQQKVTIDYPPWNEQFAPENRPFAPKGNDRIPTLHFQVLYSLLYSFRKFFLVRVFSTWPGLSRLGLRPQKNPRFPIVHSEGSLEKSIEAVKSLDVRECKASVPRLELGFLGIGALGIFGDP